jgi:hypothetical protein
MITFFALTFVRAAGFVAAVFAFAGLAHANGIGENQTWQFHTGAEKATRAAAVDLMERKRGGYYHSFQTINNVVNNTRVDRQYNCALTATSAGNGGSNGLSATTSSPGVSNSGSTSAASSANSASNALGHESLAGYLGSTGTGQLGNTQSSSGTLVSGISGSATSAVTGAVSAGGGRSDQVLNSSQSNLGSQQTASVSGSTACTGLLN